MMIYKVVLQTLKDLSSRTLRIMLIQDMIQNILLNVQRPLSLDLLMKVNSMNIHQFKELMIAFKAVYSVKPKS